MAQKKISTGFSKKSATVLLIMLIVIGVIVVKLLNSHAIIASGSIARTTGNPNAKVKIVEFIDFQCPACARGAIFLSKYMERHPDRIFLKVKYFPLGRMHKHAYRSALYAECSARQNKFWPFEALLVGKQSQWAELDDPDSVFDGMAKEVSMDMSQLDKCLSDKGSMDTVFKEKDEGNALHVESTPTYVVNGKFVVGLQSLGEELKNYFGNEN